MERRRFCCGLSGALASAMASAMAGATAGVLLPMAARGAETPTHRPLLIGLTPVFLDDQVSFLKDWQVYLEARLQRPVVFVQRGSYRDIVDLTLKDRVHFAWLCGFPFIRNRGRMRLLAVPVYHGKPLYQSYLIVSTKDVATQSLLDLRDRVFAYSDPDSNSGFLYPQYQLIRQGVRPDTHFRRSFFTYSHGNVVEAVAARVAHGGAVDGYVWDTLLLTRPELVKQTRIVERSPFFGFPPLVAAPGTTNDTLKTMQAVLLGMHADGNGKALLHRLNLDRFEAGALPLFDGIERMSRAVNGGRT